MIKANIKKNFLEVINHSTGSRFFFSSFEGLQEFFSDLLKKNGKINNIDHTDINIKILVLKIAEDEGEGVKETHGSNDGLQVRIYLNSVGIATPSPWCLAYVFYCVEKACKKLNKKNILPKTGYCPTVAEWAIKENLNSNTPEIGDIFFLKDNLTPPYYHTGFVTGVNRDYYNTIEGNTNVGGSSNGDGIYKRIRHNSNVMFVKWYKKIK